MTWCHLAFFRSLFVRAIQERNLRRPKTRAFRVASKTSLIKHQFGDLRNQHSIRTSLDSARWDFSFHTDDLYTSHLVSHITIPTKSSCLVTWYPSICSTYYFCPSKVRSTAIFVIMLLKRFVLNVYLNLKNDSQFTFFYIFFNCFIQLHPPRWFHDVIPILPATNVLFVLSNYPL